MATRTITAITAAVLLLTACTAPDQPVLDALTVQCQAGDQSACNAVPLAKSAVIREHNEQAAKIAKITPGILLLGALAVVAAKSGPPSPPPQPVFIPPPPPPFGVPPLP
jgi:hypothetical protein